MLVCPRSNTDQKQKRNNETFLTSILEIRFQLIFRIEFI